MNLEALRAWRYLHRYLLGLVVLVEVVWLVHGEPLPYWKPAELASELSSLGAGEGILLVVVLFLAGIIGGTFCELLVGFVEIVRNMLGRIHRKLRTRHRKVLRFFAPASLVLPVEELCTRILQENLDYFIEHLSLYHAGSSGPEDIEKVQEHEKEHLRRVRTLLLNLPDPLLWGSVLYSQQLTQERREIDNLRIEEEIVVFALMAGLLALALISKFTERPAFFVLMVLGILCLLGGVTRISRLRFKLAAYLAGLAILAYALTEGAEIADRDAQ